MFLQASSAIEEAGSREPGAGDPAEAVNPLELMFVILIISILLSGVSPYFFKSFADARKTTDEANLKILNTAVALSMWAISFSLIRYAGNFIG